MFFFDNHFYLFNSDFLKKYFRSYKKGTYFELIKSNAEKNKAANKLNDLIKLDLKQKKKKESEMWRKKRRAEKGNKNQNIGFLSSFEIGQSKCHALFLKNLLHCKLSFNLNY